MKVDELENDIKNIMKPIKKLSSIFPDLDMEVQFDIEQTHFHSTGLPVLVQSRNKVRQENKPIKTSDIRTIDNTRERPSTLVSIIPITRITNKSLPLQYGIRRSNDITTDSDKQIVYKKDLQKALGDLEIKLLAKIKDERSKNEMPQSSNMGLDNVKLTNLLNNENKNEPLQKIISEPSDEDLSWIKIKLPV